MDGRFQRRIQRYGWDKAVDYYEAFWRRQLAPAQERMLAVADLRPGDRVLDVACGTGLVTFPAADAVGAKGAVVGVDISQGMVDQAAELARQRGDGHVSFHRMGAEEIDLPEGSFDVALCALGIMYVPEPLRAASEMYRLLRADGRAALCTWGRRDRCGWAEIFDIVDRRVQSAVCPMFFQQGTGDTLAMTLEHSGFVDVASERLDTILEYASADDAVGAAFAAGPVALAYSRFDDATRDSAQAEYLASIEPYRQGDGYAIPGEFVIAVARR
jgi:ubiquinone/menaquinone biosynthesis C-methylase UbiE